MNKKELIEDSQLLLHHLIIKEAGKSNELLNHMANCGDDVEVKVSIGGYEVTCESFQKYFVALWEKSEESDNERIKSLLSKTLRDLMEKIEDVDTFFEQTGIELNKIEW